MKLTKLLNDNETQGDLANILDEFLNSGKYSDANAHIKYGKTANKILKALNKVRLIQVSGSHGEIMIDQKGKIISKHLQDGEYIPITKFNMQDFTTPYGFKYFDIDICYIGYWYLNDEGGTSYERPAEWEIPE